MGQGMAWPRAPDVGSSVPLRGLTARTKAGRRGGSDAADPFPFKTACGDKGFFPAITTGVSTYDFFRS